MQKQIIALAVVIVAIFASAFTTANKDKVPQAVKNAFAKKFPTAKKVDWEKENDKEWEAEFKLDKVEYSANFLEDGTWQETEHEVKEAELPQQVLSYLKTNFSDYEIEEAEVSETAQGTVYEVEIEKGKEEWKITLDFQGKVIKKQSEDEDNDDED